MGRGGRGRGDGLLKPGLALEIRVAADPAAHAAIEAAADELFLAHFGEYPWDAEAAGDEGPHGCEERVLEAVVDGRVVGFATLIDAGEYLHLEQLSVDPAWGRQGIGRALVDAVLADGSARGYAAVTLRTFLDVPWNAPFYERCGFSVMGSAPTPFHEGLVETEERLGLMRTGTRVHMIHPLLERGHPAS